MQLSNGTPSGVMPAASDNMNRIQIPNDAEAAPEGPRINAIGSSEDAKALAAAEKARSKPQLPQTSMTFATLEHKFGKLNQGAPARHTIEITNTGTNPLKLYNLVADQGATIISSPSKDVAPNEVGTIVVELITKNMESGEQTRIIHINSNAQPPHYDYKLTATVVN